MSDVPCQHCPYPIEQSKEGVWFHVVGLRNECQYMGEKLGTRATPRESEQ